MVALCQAHAGGARIQYTYVFTNRGVIRLKVPVGDGVGLWLRLTDALNDREKLIDHANSNMLIFGSTFTDELQRHDFYWNFQDNKINAIIQ